MAQICYDNKNTNERQKSKMKIRYPEYYKKFRCIAGACPDTCCAGWEIAVDRASEKRYREAQRTMENQEFAKKLKKHVKNGCIISEGATCPFLNADGLCEMYIEMGAESLCHTCARHPRHMEDYGNYMRWSCFFPVRRWRD